MVWNSNDKRPYGKFRTCHLPKTSAPHSFCALAFILQVRVRHTAMHQQPHVHQPHEQDTTDQPERYCSGIGAPEQGDSVELQCNAHLRNKHINLYSPEPILRIHRMWVLHPRSFRRHPAQRREHGKVQKNLMLKTRRSVPAGAT